MKQYTQEQLDDMRIKVAEIGQKLERRQTHTLPVFNMGPAHPYGYATTILATMDIYGVPQDEINQAAWDLRTAKYKIWDFLSMWMGLYKADSQTGQVMGLFAECYIEQQHIGAWAQWFAGHDAEMESPKKCQDCIDTYNEVMESYKAEYDKEQEKNDKGVI